MSWVLTFVCEKCNCKYKETTPVPSENQNYCKNCRVGSSSEEYEKYKEESIEQLIKCFNMTRKRAEDFLNAAEMSGIKDAK